MNNKDRDLIDWALIGFGIYNAIKNTGQSNILEQLEKQDNDYLQVMLDKIDKLSSNFDKLEEIVIRLEKIERK